MPDEMDQLPAVLPAAMISHRMIMISITGKGRHAGESDAIFDDPEQLTVAQFLCRGLMQIRRLRIKAVPNRRVPAAVVPMTNRAVIRKMQPRFALNFGRDRKSTRLNSSHSQ